MKKKRTYQTVAVQQVVVADLLPLLVAGCIVALDVAKQKFVAAIATAAGEVLALFRFEHPTETPLFLSVVEELKTALGPEAVRVAMEPTGTYGDAIRHALSKTDTSIWMVSPKRTHQGQALFDNVRSLHDPKSAALVAKLCSLNLATKWQPPTAEQVNLRALVELRQFEHRQEEACLGRLEGLLARHWPEFGQWMDLRDQKSALRVLAKYPSPARVAREPAEAEVFLAKASAGRLSKELMAGVVLSAKSTLGVPMVEAEETQLATLATRALEARERAAEHEQRMREVAKADSMFQQLAAWMGTYSAAVMVTLTNPSRYATARQLEKACGLNLREKSSGQLRGRLSITKAGPALTRQVLYLFALRMINEVPIVRAWYEARRSFKQDVRQRAVVAVMRKLVRALFVVSRGAVFDPSKLFDARRLVVQDQRRHSAPSPRTLPRAIASSKRSRRAQSQEVSSV